MTRRSGYSPLAALGGDLSLVTWNCRALVALNAADRSQRRKYLADRVLGPTFVLLQETHGNEDSLRMLFADIAGSYRAFDFPGVNRASGGTAILVKRVAIPAQATLRSRPLAVGRAMVVELRSPLGDIDVFNIHNHDMSDAELCQVRRNLDNSLRLSVTKPEKHLAMLGGDFNLMAPGEQPTSHRSGLPVACARNRPRSIAWDRMLGDWVELVGKDATHHCEVSLTAPRIDRVFVAMPRWTLLQCDADYCVVGDAFRLNVDRVSDHAPVRVTVKLRKPPPAVTEDPRLHLS